MSTITLDDLSKELGMSKSTISRALSGKGRISQDTRKRVQQAVDRSGYTVNALARSLRLKKSRVIGAIVPDITNAFCANVIKGIQRACHDHGYTMMVCNSDENPRYEEDALYTLMENQVSGLVIASVGGDPSVIERFKAAGIPVAFIDNIPQDAQGVDVVSIDNRDASRKLTRMVIEKGYRNIGMITGPLNQPTGNLRYMGFCDAMREAGLTILKEWTPEAEFKQEAGYACMKRIFESGVYPEALLVSNNFIAYGAINAIRDEGLSIPEDIAVASFDALDVTGLVQPAITCVNQPAESIGVRAAELIIDRIASSVQMPPVHELLEVSVILGNSI